MKVLGIDPGTGRLGWAIIEKKGGLERLIEYGCFETKPKTPLPVQLKLIFGAANEIIEKYKPDQVAIEELFFTKNVKTAMSVGQARGVILLTCELNGLPSFSYTPSAVKLAVTGYGKADKKQVQEMVRQILRLKVAPKPDDAADAVAIALTHTAKNRA